jgi:hypothetical protein
MAKKSNSDDNAIPVSVALRPSQLQKIDRFTSGSRSDFIRSAVDRELARIGYDHETQIENAIRGFLNHQWFENALVSMTWESASFNSNLTWVKTEERMRNVMSTAPIGSSIESVFPSDVLEWLNVCMRSLESDWEVLGEVGRTELAKTALSRYKQLKEKYGAM